MRQNIHSVWELFKTSFEVHKHHPPPHSTHALQISHSHAFVHDFVRHAAKHCCCVVSGLVDTVAVVVLATAGKVFKGVVLVVAWIEGPTVVAVIGFACMLSYCFEN